MTRRDWHADGERLRDDLAAYALGALEPEEASDLERHVDDCESCRRRVEWLRPAVDMLPASVEQRTPPESLRENLSRPCARRPRTRPSRARSARALLVGRTARPRRGPRWSWRS